DVSAFREARMPLDPGARQAPVDFEIIEEDSALRIPDIQGRAISIFDSSVKVFNQSASHIHLEDEHAAVTIEQVQLFLPRAGCDADGGARAPGLDQKRGGTTGAVARELAAAAVGIPQLDRAVGAPGPVRGD